LPAVSYCSALLCGHEEKKNKRREEPEKRDHGRTNHRREIKGPLRDATSEDHNTL
jgi:hypothetical protein